MSKFKVGQKVVPISKSTCGDLESSSVWNKAKSMNQPFIYVTGFESKGRIVCAYNETNHGDYFLEKDLVPYIEPPKKFKVGDKVVPMKKSVWGDLSESSAWSQAQSVNQPFLYVTKIGGSESPDHIVCDSYMSDSGDYFLEEDLEFYVTNGIDELVDELTREKIKLNEFEEQFETQKNKVEDIRRKLIEEVSKL